MMGFVHQVDLHGFALVEGVLSQESVATCVEELTPMQSEVRLVSGGIRNLLSRSPRVAALAQSTEIRQLVEPVLGASCFPVRGILFDKTSGTNWKIPWHQDVTIAVKARLECEGYGTWSVKDRVQHVQPPKHILEKMLSVRIHLDDCPATNGALRVLTGTHRLGKLTHAETEQQVSHREPVICELNAGGVLLMRPLLLHASSEAVITAAPLHRRVIHLDYAAIDLACGLHWYET